MTGKLVQWDDDRVVLAIDGGQVSVSTQSIDKTDYPGLFPELVASRRAMAMMRDRMREEQADPQGPTGEVDAGPGARSIAKFFDFGFNVQQAELRQFFELNDAKCSRSNLELGAYPLWVTRAASTARQQAELYEDYLDDPTDVKWAKYNIPKGAAGQGGYVRTKYGFVGDFQFRIVFRDLKDVVALQVSACGQTFTGSKDDFPPSVYMAPEYLLERIGDRLVFRCGPMENHIFWEEEVGSGNDDQPCKVTVSHAGGPLRIRRLMMKGQIPTED